MKKQTCAAQVCSWPTVKTRPGRGRARVTLPALRRASGSRTPQQDSSHPARGRGQLHPPEPATWAGSPWLRRRCPLAPASESCTELGSNGCVGPSVWRVSKSRMHAREPPSSHAGGYTAAWVPRPRPRLVSQSEARPPSTTDAARGRELPPANSTS